MITLKLSLGNTILSGLTFSTEEEQVEEIEAFIGIIGTSSEIAHLAKYSRPDQQAVHTSMTEVIAAGLSLSLIMTADTISDINYIEGKYAGLKNIVVELV